MRPKQFTNFARRLHPYEFIREGGDIFKTHQPPTFMPLLQETLVPQYQQQQQQHYHLQHSNPCRIFKDYLNNSKPAMPSLILDSSKQHYQDEQHQFILNRTSSSSSSTTTTATSTATATTTTSISSKSSSSPSSPLPAVPVTASKQHQCSNDFVQIKSNLAKL